MNARPIHPTVRDLFSRLHPHHADPPHTAAAVSGMASGGGLLLACSCGAAALPVDEAGARRLGMGVEELVAFFRRKLPGSATA